MKQPRKLSKEYFTCECCGGVFEKGSTDEEALEEMKKNFGDLPRTTNPSSVRNVIRNL